MTNHLKIRRAKHEIPRYKNQDKHSRQRSDLRYASHKRHNLFSVSDPNDFAEIVEERSVPFDYYEDDLLPDDRSVAYVDVYIAYTEQGESQMQAVADGIAALKAENLPFGSLGIHRLRNR